MAERSREKEKSGGTGHRIAEAAADVAIGGTALLADKAIEAVERAGSAVRDAREAAAAATRTAREAIDDRDTRAYEERTRDDLYTLAAERGIEGRSAMRKAELIEALRAER